MESINKKIVELTKNRDNLVDVYKEIKTNLLVKQKEKGIVPSLEDKLEIINKMIKTREVAVLEFMSKGRDELTDQYNNEIRELKSLLPKEDRLEIITFIENLINREYPELSMKNTKEILERTKLKYITVDGQLVSSVIKSKLK